MRSLLSNLHVYLLTMALICLSSGAVAAQLITVQLLDGKSGKPIAKARVDISLGDDKASHVLELTTNSQGEVQFEASGAQTFEVHQIGFASCDEQPPGSKPRDYMVEKIIEAGLVSANRCGRIRGERKKGLLLFFVRHGTWGEWLKQ